MKFNQREIVLVPFPYSDLSAVKRRPVVVISNNKFNDKSEDLVVVAITSKIYSDEYSISINDNDLEYGQFPEHSVIKIAKMFAVSKSKIIKKFSILNEEAFKKVTSKIERLIAIID